MAHELEIQITQTGDSVAVVLAGDVDLATSARVRRGFERILGSDPPPTAVRVDLAAVRFMDSIGIAVMLSARNDADALGCRLTVGAMSAAVARLMALTGLDGILVEADA